MHGVRRRVKTDGERERERAAQEAARVERYRQAGFQLRAAARWAQIGVGAAEEDAGGDEHGAGGGDGNGGGGGGDVEERLRLALGASQRVLELNPENYTAWNVRREALLLLQPVLAEVERPMPTSETGLERAYSGDNRDTDDDPGSNSSSRSSRSSKDSEERTPTSALSVPWAQVLADELRLLERAIAAHPKSYWSWLHRRWVCELALRTPEDWQRELKLCDRLLALDERNFHCWGYRRFAAAGLASTSKQDPESAVSAELAFTTKKIEDNFSNYSAWHQRSALLLQIYPDAIPHDVLDEEFDMVKNAFYTEPNDSAAWFYHAWLLARSAGSAVSSARSQTVVDRELVACRELLDLEPDSKWPMLTIVRLLRQKEQLVPERAADARDEAIGLLQKLSIIDRMRATHYKDMCACLKS